MKVIGDMHTSYPRKYLVEVTDDELALLTGQSTYSFRVEIGAEMDIRKTYEDMVRIRREFNSLKELSETLDKTKVFIDSYELPRWVVNEKKG